MGNVSVVSFHLDRDSKLTRILADSLGGDAKTALIATLGPAPQNQVRAVQTDTPVQCVRVYSRCRLQ